MFVVWKNITALCVFQNCFYFNMLYFSVYTPSSLYEHTHLGPLYGLSLCLLLNSTLMLLFYFYVTFKWLCAIVSTVHFFFMLPFSVAALLSIICKVVLEIKMSYFSKNKFCFKKKSAHSIYLTVLQRVY